MKTEARQSARRKRRQQPADRGSGPPPTTSTSSCASTAIDEAEKLKLGAHAERLKADPGLLGDLIGHMDDLGSRNYNLAITEERLTEVTNQLRSGCAGTPDSPPARGR